MRERVGRRQVISFAEKNGWLALGRSDEEVYWLLPDGTSVVAYFDNEDKLTEILDTTGSSVEV